MSDALTLTRRRALQSLKPPPVLPLATWIEFTIHFPATVSALPGKVRLWSYQRGICDAIDDPEVSRITVQKSRPHWLHFPSDRRDCKLRRQSTLPDLGRSADARRLPGLCRGGH